MPQRSKEYYQEIVRELVKLPSETEWVEFKCNNNDPEKIAKYISGMSNVATLCEKSFAYLAWGIEDKTHELVGTRFEYRKAKKGNEELESWLSRMISPKIDFKFHEIPMFNAKDEPILITLIEIPRAETEPTRYEGKSFIRIGSTLKPLSDYKEKEAELWRRFNITPFEKRLAYTEASEDAVVTLLDYPAYYRQMELPIPANREKVLQDLNDEKFIRRNDAGSWDITNLGALMLASDLKHFDGLSRKTVRVIQYKEKSRLEGIGEREFSGGYAITFESIIQYLLSVIPKNEILEGGIRKQNFSFPEKALRELLANMMIHQALDHRGTNLMVEIFADRIEFSNPGSPLVSIERIVDTVPVSRNEDIAGFMHRCGICEERGSGYDKIIDSVRQNALLAPRIENQNGQFTKVVLFSKIPFEQTAKEDRIWTCYMLACLAYVTSKTISNADIRSAFGLEEAGKVKASRIIRDTLEAKLIKPVDPQTAPRYMKYLPVWA